MRFVTSLLISALLIGLMWLAWPGRVYHTRWEGEIGEQLIEVVRSDFNTVRRLAYDKVHVDLLSPGGSVIWTMEVIQAIKDLRREGVVVEIHGGSLIASGAVFVLANGTPGHRYIKRNSLTLVHGVQQASWFSQRCVDYVERPKTEEEKLFNRVIEMLADELAQVTGYDVVDTMTWLKCGAEIIGDGNTLVNFRLVDTVE